MYSKTMHFSDTSRENLVVVVYKKKKKKKTWNSGKYERKLFLKAFI